MNSFQPIDEASLAGVRQRKHESQPSGARADSQFVTQIEQVLGENAEPDVQFFVDSWTIGVAAASENYQRRQETLKNSEHELPEWGNSFCFVPFSGGLEASAEAAMPFCETGSQSGSTVDPAWPDPEARDDGQAVDEVEALRPLTVESARRVLGVAAASTREQIRAAYRKLANRYHPDRMVRAGVREQKLASAHMASINEAYRLLCAKRRDDAERADSPAA